MEFKSILYTVQNNVATITMNMPQKFNVLNDDMYHDLLTALDLSAKDETVKAVIVNANGKAFCGGGDIGEMVAKLKKDGDVGFNEAASKAVQISFSIKQLPKPVIACVAGAVAGAAFNVVLACDFCIAAEDTKFLQAFVNIGLIPDAGGLFILTRAVGANKAAQMVMTGEVVTAAQGQELGFVYKVCGREELEIEGRALAARFAAGPGRAYARMKELMLVSFFAGWEEYAKKEVACQVELGASEDFKEGITAFIEKRKPSFHGK